MSHSHRDDLPDREDFPQLLSPSDRPFAAKLFEHAAIEGRAESTGELLSFVIGRSWTEYRRATRRRDWQTADRCRRLSELVVENVIAAEAYAAGLLSQRGSAVDTTSRAAVSEHDRKHPAQQVGTRVDQRVHELERGHG